MDIMHSRTARRLTKLATAAGRKLNVTPSTGGITEPGNRAIWELDGVAYKDAAAVRRALKPVKVEKQ